MARATSALLAQLRCADTFDSRPFPLPLPVSNHRYEKRHTNTAAHLSPCFRCKEGDTVVIGQCRPLSKTVRFNVLRVIPAGSSGKKGFASF